MATRGGSGDQSGVLPTVGRRTVQSVPYMGEADERALREPVTPIGGHFVRSHFRQRAVPHPPLSVEGAVLTPLRLTLDELLSQPWRTVRATLECAGNGRLHVAPLGLGAPWDRGGVSTAEWSGVPLREVLARAGLRDDVVEIAAYGTDAGRVDDGRTTSFAHAIPVGKALAEETLLAFAMNGEPLPEEHGAPVRLVVPGYFGMASVKWLGRLEARTRPFDGYFQTERYVFVEDGTRRPIGPQRVKSMIVSPPPDAQVATGELVLEGWAWTGRGEVVAVDVSIDGGEWRPAELLPSRGEWAWRGFRCAIALTTPGRHAVRARATDSAGEVQPEAPARNRFGYENNATVPVVLYAL